MQTKRTATELELRSARSEEAGILAQICFDAFASIADAHNFPRDFPSPDVATGLMAMMLSREDIYSVVAVENGRVVGSNFLWQSDSVAGVGPITIDPQAQNTKIGRALMQDVITQSDRSGTLSVRLVQAAYHNRSLALYTKLGFDPVEPLSNIQGAPIEKTIEGYRVRRADENDLQGIDAVALRVHGFTRHNEVSMAIEHGTVSVVEHDGRISGYTTGVGFSVTPSGSRTKI